MIVTLCGSVRFEADFKEASRELGIRGIPVFTLSVYPSDFTDETRTERGATLDGDLLKVQLDLLHQEKILRSDAILVVGDGYIGRSTAREILWASQLGRRIVSQWDFVAMRAAHPARADLARYQKLTWDDIINRLNRIDETIARNNAHSLKFLAEKALGVR